MPNGIMQAVPAPAGPAAAPQQPAPVPAPPDPTEPAPAKPAQITYKAGQLTIVAENSTLSDIISSLRTATGAAIDLPPGASTSDRFWLRLGPGPARKVLASLLSETKLDFIIQAADSESNPDGIRSVLLTVRSEPPASSVSARGMTPGRSSLPPRRSDADRRVPLPSRYSDEPRVQEEPQTPVAPEPAPSAQAAPATAPAAAPLAASAAVPPAATPASSPEAPATQAFQTLQDMYDQRRLQMQATQPAAGTN